MDAGIAIALVGGLIAVLSFIYGIIKLKTGPVCIKEVDIARLEVSRDEIEKDIKSIGQKFSRVFDKLDEIRDRL